MDLYSRLKYFYLIDVDPIVDKLKKTPTYKEFERKTNASADDLFLAIFAEIIHVAQPYCSFLLSENPVSPPSFFNELPEKRIDRISNRFLCEFSLFHHCIISSFMSQVEKHPFVTKRNEDSITLSGPNEPELTQGYFHYADSIDESNPKSTTYTFADDDLDPESRSQKFHSRYKQYHKYNQPTDDVPKHYSKQILNMHSSTAVTSAKGVLTVKSWIGNPCLFLFIDPAVKIFDKELVNTKSSADVLISKYQKLNANYSQWRNDL